MLKDILARFPQAERIEMNTLIPAANVGSGPWRLYIYGQDNLHSGGQWFRAGRLKYPQEEITLTRAKQFSDAAVGKGLEVRITDGMDHLVFHAERGQVIFGATFWNEARPDPTAKAVADRLKGTKVSDGESLNRSYGYGGGGGSQGRYQGD